jgi:IS30 family transposase
MEYLNNTTESGKYKHLSFAERVKIETFLDEGRSSYWIAKKLGRAYNTVAAEIRRGSTVQIKQGKRTDQYLSDLGQHIYEENRSGCCPKYKRLTCSEFVNAVIKTMRSKGWSVDAGIHYTMQRNPELESVSTKTFYNYIDLGMVPIKPVDLPLKLRRNTKPGRIRKNRMILGKSIEERSESASSRKEFGHWEIDTVIGRKSGKGQVLLTLAERMTRQYLVKKIAAKTAAAVAAGLNQYKELFGSRFNEVFKSITSDNGLEFSSLSEYESSGVNIYFTHPFTSCERGTNERHNGLLRRFIPKGKSIEDYSDEEIAAIEEWINNLPRKILGYATPDELFDKQLDLIYAA